MSWARRTTPTPISMLTVAQRDKFVVIANQLYATSHETTLSWQEWKANAKNPFADYKIRDMVSELHQRTPPASGSFTLRVLLALDNSVRRKQRGRKQVAWRAREQAR